MEVGDKVRVVVYGEIHKVEACASCGRATDQYKDVMPEIIGREGVVTKKVTTLNGELYELSGIPEKMRWYKLEQLLNIG